MLAEEAFTLSECPHVSCAEAPVWGGSMKHGSFGVGDSFMLD